MDERNYRMIYTESALRDLEEKADYIALSLHEPNLAEVWYERLRGKILNDLSCYPKKYPLYQAEKWGSKGIREFVFRNDVVLYSVDDAEHTVYIWAVCTKGRDLSAHLDEQMGL